MRIAIIGHALRSAGGLSVGRGLVEAFTRQRDFHDLLFILPEDQHYKKLLRDLPNQSVIWVPPQSPLQRVAFDRHQLKKAVRVFDPDAILALDISHVLSGIKSFQAVFLHSPHLIYPSRHFGPRTLMNRLRHTYLRRRFQTALPSIDLIFCQTEVVENRLTKIYKPDARTCVVGSASSPAIAQDRGLGVLLPKEFETHEGKLRLLCLGRYYPHKNLERLVETFESFDQELSDVVVFITVTPDQHPNCRKLLRRIESRGLTHRVVNLGFVPDQELAALLQRSDALLLPTMLETYGLPYVEARAMNLPIITSDLDFAHAVCGESATYFDPWEASGIFEGIIAFRDRRRTPAKAQEDRPEPSHSPTWQGIANSMLAEMAEAMAVPRTRN